MRAFAITAACVIVTALLVTLMVEADMEALSRALKGGAGAVRQDAGDTGGRH